MARSDQRSPTYPAQQTSEQATQGAQAQETSAEQVPPLLSESVLNQIVGMVLRRANVQAATTGQPAGQDALAAAIAQALGPPPLTRQAQDAIAKYRVLAHALTHE
jgi:hypothetical protein